MAQSYAKSGVDIKMGDKVVDHIKKAVRSTYSKSVLGGIGSFGAFFDARFQGYKSPVLVSSVDGVGTKLMVAQMMGKHDTVGHDLVNHCVNDILVCGAKPLYFMDYFATGKLSLNVARDIIDGFVKGCLENQCSLIGGETAEMPGFYGSDEYDLSGTIVGVVDKQKIVSGKSIRRGDILIGLRSSGLHTNGYSLARSVLLTRYKATKHIDELGCDIGSELLKVHRSYLSLVMPVLKKFKIKGLSHVTGGGIVGNTKRILPKGLSLKVNWGAWQRPPIFDLIKREGSVSESDMRRAFNLGIGLILVVSPGEADKIFAFLRKRREEPVYIGEIVGSAN